MFLYVIGFLTLIFLNKYIHNQDIFWILFWGAATATGYINYNIYELKSVIVKQNEKISELEGQVGDSTAKYDMLLSDDYVDYSNY